MVNEVIINCKNLNQREQAHLYLAQMLHFPEYYGKNLDALFDCLTELGDCTILLDGGKDMLQAEGYGAKVIKVIEEAAVANPRINLEIH